MSVPAPDDVVAAVAAAGQRILDTGPRRSAAETLLAAATEVYHELGDSLASAGPAADPDLVALGAAHERLLEHAASITDDRFLLSDGATARKAGGSYFTPLALVEHLLDLTLAPALEEADDPLALRVLDPACGTGLFLAVAARRIADRAARQHSATPPEEHRRRAVAECVVGVDVDPLAVELARITLLLWCASTGPPPTPQIVVADALLDDPVPHEAFDVVVGNPPFGNQLERLTVRSAETEHALRARANGALAPYTDLSAVFLHRAVGWVRDGGRVGLVQPQSLLAARDAAGVRRELASTCALESLWSSEKPVFEANVVTCAPVLRKGARQEAVRRTHGSGFDHLPPVEGVDLTAEWSPLMAGALGIPPVHLTSSAGTVGDVADCTADFRDQYYGLAAYVHEAADCPAGAPLVTSGLIDPARCRWGSAMTRFLRRRWQAPVVDLEALQAEPRLAAWAQRRRVPKVLVATQGRVIEAVADVAGDWLPSVPTITVTTDEDKLWHVLAVLLAPPVSAHAAARYAGAALSTRAVKLSARQVAHLPLPPRRQAWDRGAELVEVAQTTGSDPDLREFGQTMCHAYDTSEDVLFWWLSRFPVLRPD